MPWKSSAQRAKMSQVWSKERVAEWDAATDFDKLPDYVGPTGSTHQREATRKSGRKKGLARLTKMAGLGCILFTSCAKPPLTPDQVRNVSTCQMVKNDAIEASNTCPEAQLRIDASPACKAIGGISLDCPEFRK